ncbi:MAG: hypothetical protein KJ808_05985 [Acidobacteria bacterium]|nr:hypothetical protein [Acidobacteriota bacterium]MBU4306800.1 hypothetical protein [Acidobacteriota bacterium]MCG2812590.1 hypothetical protein [Candidatus Aminicenantes bacterium]
MNQTRTILGLIIMIFFAIPVLFGIIWAVGLTQAVVSQKTLSELPGEIIAEIPDLLDGMVLAARDENSDLDYDSRTWLTAMDGASPTPGELMKETGLNDWLEKELSGSLRTLGDILNGKTAARDIWLDMRPLKAVFNHPTMERWLSQVMEKLPPCSASQAGDWERFLLKENRYDPLPPCRPMAGQQTTAIALIRSHITRDIPDQINLSENTRFPHHRYNIAKTVMSFTYLLFLIPVVFIVLGALVAARSKSHFLRWSGAATMIGGGLVLAMSSLVKGVIPWAMRIGPVNYSSSWTHWQDVFSDHTGGLALVVSRHFISPVIAVAGIVCVVGLLLFAFSFTFTRETAAKTHAPQPPQAS